MDIEQKIKESEKKRSLEKDKLFKMMLSNEDKKKVKEQYKNFQNAHQKYMENLSEAYKNVA